MEFFKRRRNFMYQTYANFCNSHWNKCTRLVLYMSFLYGNKDIWRPRGARRLGARLPPLGSRVRVSVTPCRFRGGRNGVWVGFSRGFSRFPLPQISFHHFSTLISSISFHFISPCDDESGVIGRHPCYTLTYNIGASSHLIRRLDLVLDTSWGYFIINLFKTKIVQNNRLRVIYCDF